MKKLDVCLIGLLMLVSSLGCASYLTQGFHIYEGDPKPLDELAVIRLEFSHGLLDSVDGKEVYMFNCFPVLSIYFLAKEI